MSLKAFEPKHMKTGKSDMNILAQTSGANHDKPHHHTMGQKFSPGAEKLFVAMGI